MHKSTHAFYASESNWQPVNIIQQSITLAGTIMDGHHLGVTYGTLPGNQPAKNGNLVAYWQNTGIPWGQTPTQKQGITKNEPSGDQIFDFPIQRLPYVVAYGLSDTNKAWAGTIQFTPGSGVQGTPFVTSVNVQAAGNDSLLALFSTPVLNNPNVNENWIGLWQGTQPTYDGSNRIKKVTVTSTIASDSQSMSGLTLTMNTTYCLAYAVGPKDSDIAAWVTFTTQPF